MTNRFTKKINGIDWLKHTFRSLVAGMFILLVSNNGFAQPVNIIFTPSSPTVQVGQNFTVDVIADFTAPGTLSTIETYINFNPLDLQVVSTPVVPAGTATLLPSESVAFSSVSTMNTAGRIDYGRFTISAGGHPNSDFVFFTITFKALRVPPGGNTTLAFNTVNPRRTIAVEGATVVSNQITNSVINISACTPPTASISNAGTCNGQPFNLILNNDATGTGPFDLVINGTTYNDIPAGGTITTFAPPNQNIFGSTPPVANDEVDPNAVTLGLKFRSTVAGFVKGVRFYSQAVPAGTFTGQLWPGTGGPGTLPLASATFSSVTGSAWNQVFFSSPVLITANTTYIVSYHAPSGYRATANGLNTTITNGTLSALSNGSSGGNGVYMYDMDAGSAGANFPSNSFQSTNYWVDVVFTPSNYTFDLTSITDNGGCSNVAAPLQSLSVTSVDCSALPVTLLSLSATPQGNNVLLRWSTASEIDNKGFEIQRSTANTAWESVGFVNGAGNSSSLLNYSHTDLKLFTGRYYYRLKQVDIDGNYKYSMVVSALIDGKEEYAVRQNYPNPFHGETTIQYTLPAKSKVNVTVYDMNGRVMKVLLNATKDAGNHALVFYSGSLPAGMYYYQVQAGDFKDTKKMVVQ